MKIYHRLWESAESVLQSAFMRNIRPLYGCLFVIDRVAILSHTALDSYFSI